MELANEVRKTVVVKDKPSTCYVCDQNRYIKRIRTVNISLEQAESVKYLNEDGNDSEEGKQVKETLEIETNATVQEKIRKKVTQK